MFERAIDLDPHYARAYAGLADCDTHLKLMHGVRFSAEEIRATANKALAIDPNLAEAHAACGYAMTVSGQRREASEAFEQAIRLDPNCYQAHLYYGRFFVTLRNFEMALRHFLRAMEIQPGHYFAPASVCQVLQSLGRYEDAAKYARVGLRRAEEEVQRHGPFRISRRPLCVTVVRRCHRGSSCQILRV